MGTSEIFKDPSLPLNDCNFLKCACCGKYKVDTNEEFYVNFGVIKKKYWLCETCNRARDIFVKSGDDLKILITPGRKSTEEYAIFTRDSVCM